MSSDLRLKKLRGSGGHVMASVTDDQQMKGNLGGPDLFLAPMGRLDPERISRHFCNTCEKEFEGPPKIEFERPNEEVAENLILAERGQYVCGSCDATIAEYRDFKKPNEAEDVGVAKPLEPQAGSEPEQAAGQSAADAAAADAAPAAAADAAPADAATTEAAAAAATVPPAPQEPASAQRPERPQSIASIEGRAVYDENASRVGTAKHVGIDSAQSMVLVITGNDGAEGVIAWSRIKKIGEIILLGGGPEAAGAEAEATPQPEGRCPSCGFSNKVGSKFCEECGAKLQ